MAKIPLPARGQPFDLAYVYALAEAMNQIVTDANSALYNEVQGTSVKSTDTKIVAKTITAIASGTQAAGTIIPFSTSYSGFTNVPIATATPIMSDVIAKANNVTVMLTSVTVSQLNGYIRFDAAVTDSSSVSINVILIGLPTG